MTREVAKSAAEFGLQGAVEALNLFSRRLGIAAIVINPDHVATPEIEDDIAQGRFPDQTPFPMDDMTRTIDYVLGISPHSAPSLINLRRTKPEK